MIEDVAVERQAARPAIDGDSPIEAIRIRSGLRGGVEVEFQIIGDEEVQLAVIVVVDEGAASVVADAVLGQMNFRRDILKPAAVVCCDTARSAPSK